MQSLRELTLQGTFYGDPRFTSHQQLPEDVIQQIFSSKIRNEEIQRFLYHLEKGFMNKQTHFSMLIVKNNNVSFFQSKYENK